jgi:hypothetical protein
MRRVGLVPGRAIDPMLESMFKKLAIFLVVFVCWVTLGAFVFKGAITDRYFVMPYGLSKYTDRNNGVTIKQMNLLVPVTLGARRLLIPSAYLSRLGHWDPVSRSYGGQLALAAAGSDFKPMPGALADNDVSSLNLWLDVNAPPPPSDLVKTQAPKVLPATVAQFEAGVRRDPKYWLRDGLTRAPELDRFGLQAYRDKFWGETYVGSRDAGGILLFHCQSSETVAQPVCEVFDARYADQAISVKYAYAKSYMAQWRHFDTGVNRLVQGFQRK